MAHSLPETFAPLLLRWYAAGHRDLPWRQDREPYHIWLSEIMLQQTRVEAVRGYYARFLAELPDIAALAACEERRLTKLWEGLGYYSRVRNLQKAAQVIVSQHGGVFPADYAAIRALPGVGDYTAGAVASICFDRPTPAVDGNVLRVLARVTEDPSPVTKQSVKKSYELLLRPVYEENPGSRGELTQALMELGACVCVPNGAPKCALCPLQGFCRAKMNGSWAYASRQGGQKAPAAGAADRLFPLLRQPVRRAAAAGYGAARGPLGAAEHRRDAHGPAGAFASGAVGPAAGAAAEGDRADARLHARRVAHALLLCPCGGAGRGLYLGGWRGIFAQHRPADSLPDVLGAGRRAGGEITVAFL